MADLRGFVNNFTTALDGSINNSQTSFDVVDASVLASALAVATVDYIAITVDDGSSIEIMHCTGVASDTLTVVRGREGTSGTAFSNGVAVECRVTVQGLVGASEWQPVEVRVLGADTTNVDFDVSDYVGDQKIVFCGVTIATDAQDIYFQQGSPTVQTSTYYGSGNFRTYLSSANNVPINNQAQLTLLSSASNSALNTISGEIEMTDPSNSGIRHVCKWRFCQQSKDQEGVGIRDNTEVVETFRFSTASGDFKAGSKFIRYVRNN